MYLMPSRREVVPLLIALTLFLELLVAFLGFAGDLPEPVALALGQRLDDGYQFR